MSLNETDRQVLINLEYEKAKRFIEQANNNYKIGIWDIAANRYYYACFHAVQALFIKDGIESHRHAGLLRLFGQHYVKTEVIDRKFGPFLHQMEQLRTKADYNVLFEVNKEELDSMIEPSHELIEAIGELLYNHQG